MATISQPLCVEFDAHRLNDKSGQIYHVIPSEQCSVKLVERANGRIEAAFIRSGGAWLPAVFANLP